MIRITPPLGEDWVTFGRNIATRLTQIFGFMGADRLSWNETEDTLNISHSNGEISQQVGFEQYMRIKNTTGSTIPNGTVIGFSGVSGDITGAPYIADGSVSSLYFIGVTTIDMQAGETHPVTVFGKVRDLDTSAWSVGDILYASPTTAGALTSARPTAPQEVIVVAAVLVSHATDGEIMVRPTIPIGLDYGSFSDTTDQTIAAVDTAYPINLNTTDISHGVTVVNDGSGNPTKITVSHSGFYSISVSNQYTSSNASAQDIQTWLRHNGTDIANSNSYTTIANNGATQIFSTTYSVSMQAGDYLQIMWASDSTNVSINNIAATGYSPAAPSTIVTVTQIQL